MNIWERLLASPGVVLLNLRHDRKFRAFVESLPARTSDLPPTLSFDTLVALQHRAIAALALPMVQRTSGIERLRRLLENAEEYAAILHLNGKHPHDHCRTSGMSETDIAAMEAGAIRTAAFVQERPDVVLHPLLSQLVRTH